jgi:hypothetical protein
MVASKTGSPRVCASAQHSCSAFDGPLQPSARAIAWIVAVKLTTQKNKKFRGAVSATPRGGAEKGKRGVWRAPVGGSPRAAVRSGSAPGQRQTDMNPDTRSNRLDSNVLRLGNGCATRRLGTELNSPEPHGRSTPRLLVPIGDADVGATQFTPTDGTGGRQPGSNRVTGSPRGYTSEHT